MSAVYAIICVLLLVTIAAGLYRVFHGPGLANRLLAIQLFGTTGLAIVLLLGAALDIPAAKDIAVVFALLAALTGTAFARCLHSPGDAQDRKGPS